MARAWLAALFVGVVAACDDPPAPAPTWPAGTVLAVDDVPISLAQVDADSVFVERLESAAAPAQLRRLALTNISLPRVLARLIAPEACAQARARAEDAATRLHAGTYPLPQDKDALVGERIEGDWARLGMCAWGVAMDLGEGAWSDVIEQPGHFVVLRRLGRTEGPVPRATQVAVDALVFPWIEAKTVYATLETEYDRHVLTIVDPAWREIVPELLQNRMRKKP